MDPTFVLGFYLMFYFSKEYISSLFKVVAFVLNGLQRYQVLFHVLAHHLLVNLSHVTCFHNHLLENWHQGVSIL